MIGLKYGGLVFIQACRRPSENDFTYQKSDAYESAVKAPLI
jgi:hypothetical protein